MAVPTRENAESINAHAPEMFDLLQSLHERLMAADGPVKPSVLEHWAEEIDDVLTRAEGIAQPQTDEEMATATAELLGELKTALDGKPVRE